MKENTISIISIVKNEEKRIEKMLNSIKDFADEVIIVDDHSTDNTLEIVKKIIPQAKIYQRKMENQDHGFQRNFGYEKCTSEWILWLDADEILTNKLKSEIKEKTKTKKYNGFYVPRINHDFVKTKEKHLRLFRKDTGKNTHGIHSVTIVKGEIGELTNPLQHYSWTDIGTWLNKILSYSQGDAERWFLQEKRDFNKFQIFLIGFLMPPIMFLKWYFKDGYFKSGLKGLLYSLGSSTTWIFKAMRYYELKYKKFQK